MKKIQNKYGFSMAELLMVVAILVALFGVAFVAVQNHQRSMTQLEYDTIAKEIFVAAQNHLTAVESQGYLGQITEKSGYGIESDYKNESTSENDTRDEVFYLTKGTAGQEGMLDLMLPFGAIDETIRAGGSYIIRYQPSSGRVLDVFYSKPGPVTAWLTIKGAEIDGKYTALMNLRGDDKKADRRKCEAIGGAVVGWYGDGDALPIGSRLNAPQILIHNEETLWVEVKDTNGTGANRSDSLVLIVTGETSEAKKAFNLRNDTTTRISEKSGELGVYKIVLDDITREGFHFAEISDTSGSFIPGENITVEAVAYNNGALTNIAYSGKGRTNSIFADPSSYIPASTESQGTKTDDIKVNGTVVDKTSGTAAVANIRHLENLDRNVSNWGSDDVQFSSAIQLTNLSDGTDENTEKPGLSWESFVKKTAGVIYTKGSKSYTNYEQYLPVNLEQGFYYFGRNHIISKITTDGKLNSTSLDAGVFGTLNGGGVSDLLILDSEISSSGNAGGLIGSMSGTTVERCAANGTVTGGVAAGGLIGEAGSGTVTACYSAGHTSDGSYEKWIDANKTETKSGYDVNGTTAGGLIGSSRADIIDSYSTCSVSGTSTAGGFVGAADGGRIDNCYATGLVATKPVSTNGSTNTDQSVNGSIGSFAGSVKSMTSLDGQFFGIINEVKRTEKTDNKQVEVFDHYLGAVGDAAMDGITEIDSNTESYELFVGAPGAWTKAEPHDKALKIYYQEKYNLKGISRLTGTSGTEPEGETEETEPIVATHYGDWPAPEIFVINQQ